MLYKCKCITSNGQVIIDSIEAKDFNELKRLIENKDLKLIRAAKENSITSKINSLKKRKLKQEELAELCSQIYFVLNSNTTLLNGLQIIKSDKKKDKVSQVIEHLYSDVEKGSSLSESMQSISYMFPKLFIYMIMSGELSGNLSTVFRQMQLYYETQGEIKKKVQSALMQPAILIVIAFGMLIFFLNFVLPEIMTAVEIGEDQLPLITRIVIGFSNYISAYYYYIIITIILVMFFGSKLYQNENVRFQVHKVLSKTPMISSFIKHMETYRFSMTLHLLLEAGVNLLETLDTIQNIMSNEVAKKSVKETKDTLLEGNRFYEGLSKSKFFDESFLKAIRIGEETGSLDDVLEQMSEYYKKKVDNKIKKTLALLEPMLTVGVGVFVGILILSIALPVFSMMDYIQ